MQEPEEELENLSTKVRKCHDFDNALPTLLRCCCSTCSILLEKTFLVKKYVTFLHYCNPISCLDTL